MIYAFLFSQINELLQAQKAATKEVWTLSPSCGIYFAINRQGVVAQWCKQLRKEPLKLTSEGKKTLKYKFDKVEKH